MNDFDTSPTAAPRIWEVGALCRAVGDALSARFNPVAVRGELSGFSRAASGHCYFNLKDVNGQIRCAMFKRAAQSLGFTPRDGELVEVVGKLGVYEQRGDLQLVVEDMRRAGQGALFEQFLRLKAQLEAEGLFDAARKRPLPLMPRGVGIVTSLGAAALHDVVTALRRRVPQLPVVLVPALVQGGQAAPSMVDALQKLYRLADAQIALDAGLTDEVPAAAIDTILLVRGGGSLEDLWAFNDEQLARTIVQSPVPLISGVGHETDFTIADFCADLRAPTPTAAAELVCQPRDVWLGALDLVQERLDDAVERHIDRQLQRLDMAARQIARPSGLVHRQQQGLDRNAQRLQAAVQSQLHGQDKRVQHLASTFPVSVARSLERQEQHVERLGARLELLNPRQVLSRGYALLTGMDGQVIHSVTQATPGKAMHAELADGSVDVVATQRLLV
ncbi:exodeoxyribonuclease VII large subunit [Comamonas odontotermitis]|uniref:exodeoxyribonuclease VII large subunit n=1 Tax=Comamonas odontotermitis TaxID=379895 RepID=UPI001CC399AC|nr:exodeoxyribonuclease VII large subunit [Comamonas odontotermitis]UBB15846.1 exodeoxyribonuclease VII large subunit [Comamonas odontotermitis]